MKTEEKTINEILSNILAERFDFNADTEKLEVKISSNMERIHVFTSE